MSTETVVVFRVWTKESNAIIALFPYEDEGHGFCGSFMHVGQHGAADYQGIIRASRPAKQEEYQALKLELESAPYNYKLKVQRRR